MDPHVSPPPFKTPQDVQQSFEPSMMKEKTVTFKVADITWAKETLLFHQKSKKKKEGVELHLHGELKCMGMVIGIVIVIGKGNILLLGSTIVCVQRE
jgi:hypothetical protein